MNMKIRRKENDNFKQYEWRKEWVRPYESVYSVLRNFCKVNCIDGSKIGKIFGYDRSLSEDFNSTLLMYNNTILYPLRYESLMNILFDNKHKDFLRQFQKIHNKDQTVLFDKHIKYCPDCMKYNYHSIYHNLNSIKKCPFHNIELIETPYAYSSVQSITFSTEDNSFINVNNCILPCECTNKFIDVLKSSKSIYPDLIEVFISISANNNLEVTFRNQYKPFFSNNNPDKVITYEPGCYEHLQDQFCEWFNSNHIYSLDEDIQNPLKITQFDKRNLVYPSDYTKYFLYYKMYHLLKDEIAMSTSPGHIMSKDSIIKSYDDIGLKLAFVWSIIGFDSLSQVLSPTWIYNNYSTLDFKRREYIDIQLQKYEIDSRFYGTGISKEDRIIILLIILNDMFDYLWKAYKKSVRVVGEINAYNSY